MSSSLITQRFRLRPLESLRDRTTLYMWENEASVWASSGAFNPISYRFIDQFILESTVDIIEKRQMSLMLESTETADSIGYLQLFDYEPVSRRISLGIYIAVEYRRQGYAAEALGVIHAYLEQRLNCSMIYAAVLSGNHASQRLFEHAGYRHTATLERWHWQDGVYQHLMYYQLWLQ